MIPACDCVLAQARAEIDRRRRDEALQRARRLIESSRLGPRYGDCSFETFQADAGNREALGAAKAFVADFPAGGRGLLILGGFGCGKTHLAASIVGALLGRGAAVLFLSVPEFLDVLRAAAADEISESSTSLMEAAKTAELLVLDDLGAERITDRNREWVQERLYVLVDHRYRHMLPTVVTTNWSLDELWTRVGGRTLSRLMEMTRQAAIEGPDRRLRPPGGATGGAVR